MDERILKWLFDIKLSIEEIDSYFQIHGNDFFKYRQNLMMKRAVERNREIIGEAMNRIITRDSNFEEKITNAKAGNFFSKGYFGITSGFSYTTLANNNPDATSILNNYRYITITTTGPVINTFSNASFLSTGTFDHGNTTDFSVGPTFSLPFNKFSIDLKVPISYFTVKQNGYKLVDSFIDNNGVNYNLNFASAPDIKTSGFAASAQFQLNYCVSNSFALFANTHYTIGTAINTTSNTYKPSIDPLPTGIYDDLHALESGTQVTSAKSTNWQNIGFNVGLTFYFKKNDMAINTKGVGANDKVIQPNGATNPVPPTNDQQKTKTKKRGKKRGKN